MSRSEKQKQKLFRILEILLRDTDSSHGITSTRIIELLDTEFGIKAERRSIYDDLITLGELGFEVERLNTNPTSYTLANRLFEMPELKMLVDAVQSSKFITAKKSRDIINKLSVFAGSHGAAELSRQVFVEDRVKTVNTAVVYSVDTIHSAINGNKQITFGYFDYDGDKKKVLRHNGRKYVVSPSALIWSDENYYLAGYDEREGMIKNFRVDKMQCVEITDIPRSDTALSTVINPADYTRKIFGMYGGTEELVTVAFRERLSGVVIDRFGQSVTFRRTGDDEITASLRVMVSPTFFSWVMSFGADMRIVGPDWVREELVAKLKEICASYGIPDRY
jgi:predicted DNA-binding transcriptional regulator YafY